MTDCGAGSDSIAKEGKDCIAVLLPNSKRTNGKNRSVGRCESVEKMALLKP